MGNPEPNVPPAVYMPLGLGFGWALTARVVPLQPLHAMALVAAMACAGAALLELLLVAMLAAPPDW